MLFAALRSRLARRFGNQIPVRERDEWERYFGERKREVERLSARIADVESEVNERVYRLFDLDRDRPHSSRRRLRVNIKTTWKIRPHDGSIAGEFSVDSDARAAAWATEHSKVALKRGGIVRVSTLDLANLPRTPEGKVDFAQDFFGREAFLTVSGHLNVEAYCLALTKVYTFGPTFRAENSNTRPPRRVLDDRAGNRLCRPLGQCRLGGSVAQIHLRGVGERKTGRSRLLRPAHREGAGRETQGDRRLAIRAYGLRRGDPSAERANEKFEFPVKWGIDLQSEHERYLPKNTRRSRSS